MDLARQLAVAGETSRCVIACVALELHELGVAVVLDATQVVGDVGQDGAGNEALTPTSRAPMRSAP